MTDTPTTAAAPTLDQLLAVGGTLWERDAMRRVYFNDLHALADLDVSRYNTGNISCASWQGERLSNTRAGEICSQLTSGKFWFDLVDGKFWFRIPNARTASGSELGNLIVRNLLARIADLPSDGEG